MSTGVLQFVKGIDFSRNDFSGDRFPHDVEQMTQMTWLKLNKTKLENVPDELSRCENLEHLQMAHNQLTSVHGELSDLPRLRSVIVRDNNLKTAGIPTDIFRMKDLTIIDLSRNQLREVPANVEYAKGAIVLNLSHNNIETIPNAVFGNLIDLLFLDLSANKLEMLPPQIRRLTMLQTLVLSNNPLTHFQLKQLPSMSSLNVLHMSNTSRTLDNIPPSLDDLHNLRDVDFSENNLPAVPDALFKMRNLRKLNLAGNKITNLNMTEGDWENIETLNISNNELTSLPECIVKLAKLSKLYASGNLLTFEGIPPGIGKLLQLTVLHLSFNKLELVPEGISRCVKLQRLKLDHNRLITLPEGIHLLPDLKQLDLHDNENLVIPPKPNDHRRKLAFYNIDFSLEHQRKIAGQMTSPSSSVSSLHSGGTRQDALSRKKEFIRRRKQQADQQGADKVIQGMSKIAGIGASLKQKQEEEEEKQIEARSAINWKKNLEKQRKNIDYSDIFDEDVGEFEGMWVWEIENFYPSIMDDAFHGQFYDADCYLVLKTTKEISGQLRHEIYYWLGEHASLDKGMCAAVHAVGLRNHLNATCRTIREEMNDESEEFLTLFGEEIVYIEGARTTTGFYTTEKPQHVTRLYRASVNGISVEMEPVPLSVESLDPRFCFLLDAGETMWIWSGFRSRITVANKARLFAERLNKRDRKGKSEIETCRQQRCPPEFWIALTGSEEKPNVPIREHVPETFVPERKRLYRVNIGMGFLELPQVELPKGVAKQEMLNTKCVYILDTGSDIFLWTGKKANRLLKMAGQKMVVELDKMIERPDYSQVYRETEGEESMMFRSKFLGWDEIVPVDFTRTSESVQRVPDLNVIVKKDNMLKTDLSALFLERQPMMSYEESEELMLDCNDDLELMESFVLEGKKFVKLPPKEFGIFYTMDCYVFLCRYAVLPDEDEEDEEADGDDDYNDKADFKCVVYFWQGRDASNMGWLNFTFQLQPNFEQIFKDKLEVLRMYQQQENHKFLSHFKRKFLIKRGRRGLTRNLGGKWPELYQMRANGSSVCNRTIQIDCQAKQLCSAFCHILRIPYKEVRDGKRGVVYTWVGKHVEPHEPELVQQVAADLVMRDDDEEFDIVQVREGEENEEFWQALGGQKKYETDASFVKHTRLFRCTNEKGYFAVSEKTVDFCQDDLDDDDIMILDNGDAVFLWIGARSSEIEAKLAYKAATVYQAHMRMKQPEKPRKLLLSMRGRESSRFRKCFHAWGKMKQALEF